MVTTLNEWRQLFQQMRRPLCYCTLILYSIIQFGCSTSNPKIPSDISTADAIRMIGDELTGKNLSCATLLSAQLDYNGLYVYILFDNSVYDPGVVRAAAWDPARKCSEWFEVRDLEGNSIRVQSPVIDPTDYGLGSVFGPPYINTKNSGPQSLSLSISEHNYFVQLFMLRIDPTEIGIPRNICVTDSFKRYILEKSCNWDRDCLGISRVGAR